VGKGGSSGKKGKKGKKGKSGTAAPTAPTAPTQSPTAAPTNAKTGKGKGKSDAKGSTAGSGKKGKKGSSTGSTSKGTTEGTTGKKVSGNQSTKSTVSSILIIVGSAVAVLSVVGIVAIRRRYNKMRATVVLTESRSGRTLGSFMELDLYYPQPIQSPITPTWIPSDRHRTAAAGAPKLRELTSANGNHLV
jgi:hypothetical protein